VPAAYVEHRPSWMMPSSKAEGAAEEAAAEAAAAEGGPAPLAPKKDPGRPDLAKVSPSDGDLTCLLLPMPQRLGVERCCPSPSTCESHRVQTSPQSHPTPQLLLRHRPSARML
jgi:hypothetical protein